MSARFAAYNLHMVTSGDPHGFVPGQRVTGVLRPPGSKSESLRVVVAAGLARGTTGVAGLSPGGDARAALDLVAGAGADVERVGEDAARVTGAPPGPGAGWHALLPVSAGESATLARVATACFALGGRIGGRIGGHGLITVEGTLRRRTSPALLRALRAAGARVECRGAEDGWPVAVEPVGPPPELELVEPSSSQEVSALLVALAARDETSRLRVRGRIPSHPYVGLTCDVLHRFGAEVEQHDVRGAGPEFVVRGPLAAPREPLVVEPDASLAAVGLAAACLTGGELTVPDLSRDSYQGDARIVEHLAALGCDARERGGALTARGRPRRGAVLDLEGEPDLAPVLAPVAAAAAIHHGASTRLDGLRTLRGKECDRLDVLSRALRMAGADAHAEGDALVIRPGEPPTDGIHDHLLDPADDHRMAYAGALLGLVVPGIRVANPGCVDKTWPGFWSDLEALGARPAR
jgi:3-phosphoshikimate 1-carboxyvinyltransferase